MASAIGTNAEDIHFFETGYIMIEGRRFDVEEISINTSRDMTPYHVAAQRDPIDQRPGKNKIEFSFKRAFSSRIFFDIYDKMCVFQLLLVNNDNPDSPQDLVLLNGCRLTQDNIGPVNGSDVVSEDLSGVAVERVMSPTAIKDALATNCSTGDASNMVNKVTSDVKNANDWAGQKINEVKHTVTGNLL